MNVAHHVSCGEYFHFMSKEDEWVVRGFASADLAAEYARRFVRAQIEHFRKDGTASTALEAQYFVSGDYAWHSEVDHKDWVRWCIANPATRPEETDYESLDPRKAA